MAKFFSIITKTSFGLAAIVVVATIIYGNDVTADNIKATLGATAFFVLLLLLSVKLWAALAFPI